MVCQVVLAQVSVDQVVDQVLPAQVEARREELDAVPREVRVVAVQVVLVEVDQVDQVDVALVSVVHTKEITRPTTPRL